MRYIFSATGASQGLLTPEQLAMTNSFGTGECLADIWGANALNHAQMRQSPFKLTKEGD